MPQVFSTQFATSFYGAGSSGDHTFYTVPANKVAVLRQLTAIAYAAPMTCQLLLAGALELVTFVFTTATVCQQWNGRIVFKAGDAMAWRIGANGFGGSAHGYLLSA